MKGNLLSARQLFWTAFLMMFPTIILLLPGDLVRLGGRYGWWTPLADALLTVPLVGVLGRLAGRHGDAVAVPLDRLGPILGRIIVLLLWAGLGAYAVIITREFAAVAETTYVSGDVPLAVLTALGLIVAGLAARLGIVVVARGAEVMAPALLAVLVALAVAALPTVHVIWALPLLPRNAGFAAPQALGRTATFLIEPALLALVMGQADRPTRRRAGTILAGATAAAAGLTAVFTWAMIAQFGPPRAGEVLIPFFLMAKRIMLGSFLTHLELLFIPIILAGGAGKMAIYYWLWVRCGEGLTGGGRGVWLILGLLGLGTASVIALPNPIVLDRSMYVVLTLGALPTLLAALLLTYGFAAVLRPRGTP